LHRILWMLALLALAGSTSRETIELHYLKGFVPRTRAIFRPTTVAVAPTGGSLASGSHDIGGIYDASGNLTNQLTVTDAGTLTHDAIMTALADAGLKPTSTSSDVGLTLSCDLEQLAADKRFGAQQTIHGQYFTMTSRVKMKCTLRRRDGSEVYDNEILGAEDEPPKPVGGESFLPLEEDPAESLSVALSRAVGALILDPKFRAALPSR
jgi:hypothetical protein